METQALNSLIDTRLLKPSRNLRTVLVNLPLILTSICDNLLLIHAQLHFIPIRSDFIIKCREGSPVTPVVNILWLLKLVLVIPDNYETFIASSLIASLTKGILLPLELIVEVVFGFRCSVSILWRIVPGYQSVYGVPASGRRNAETCLCNTTRWFQQMFIRFSQRWQLTR